MSGRRVTRRQARELGIEVPTVEQSVRRRAQSDQATRSLPLAMLSLFRDQLRPVTRAAKRARRGVGKTGRPNAEVKQRFRDQTGRAYSTLREQLTARYNVCKNRRDAEGRPTPVFVRHGNQHFCRRDKRGTMVRTKNGMRRVTPLKFYRDRKVVR